MFGAWCARKRRGHVPETNVLKRRFADNRHTSICFRGVQCKAWLTVNTFVTTSKVVDDNSHACGIKHTFTLFHRDWHFELEVHDERHAILFDILRCAGVKNFTLSLVRDLFGQTKILVIFIRHVFSAIIVLDTIEFDGASSNTTIEHRPFLNGHHVTGDGHHVQGTTFDAAGNLEKC